MDCTDRNFQKPSKTRQSKKSYNFLGFFLIPLVLGYALDQSTKGYVTTHMVLGEIIPVTSWFRFLYVRNSGAAFSMGQNVTIIFTVIMTCVLVAICVYVFSKVTNNWWATAFGLIAAGAAGNLTDRLFRSPGWGWGEVVDFLSFWNFAIFNIADVLVSCGIAACFILLLCKIDSHTKPSKISDENEVSPHSQSMTDNKTGILSSNEKEPQACPSRDSLDYCDHDVDGTAQSKE